MMMSIRLFNRIAVVNSGSNYVHMPNYRANNAIVVNKFYLRGNIH